MFTPGTADVVGTLQKALPFSEATCQRTSRGSDMPSTWEASSRAGKLKLHTGHDLKVPLMTSHFTSLICNYCLQASRHTHLHFEHFLTARTFMSVVSQDI